MGGGGGQRGPTPVTKGTPPKFAEQQIVPPKAPPLERAEDQYSADHRGAEGREDGQQPSADSALPNSPLVGMSMGNGHGTGLGSGNGSGLGPGSGGNTGGGPRRIGGGVSAPRADLFG